MMSGSRRTRTLILEKLESKSCLYCLATVWPGPGKSLTLSELHRIRVRTNDAVCMEGLAQCPAHCKPPPPHSSM